MDDERDIVERLRDGDGLYVHRPTGRTFVCTRKPGYRLLGVFPYHRCWRTQDYDRMLSGLHVHEEHASPRRFSRDFDLAGGAEDGAAAGVTVVPFRDGYHDDLDEAYRRHDETKEGE